MDTSSRKRTALAAEQIRAIMSKIQTHSFKDNRIRTVDHDGQRWIVFADVCRALGYKNPSHEARALHPSEKVKLDIGLKNTLALCISKSGLYILTVFSGKRDAAELYNWALENDVFADSEWR